MRDYQNATTASNKAPLLWTRHHFMDASPTVFPWSRLLRKLKAAVVPFPQPSFKNNAPYYNPKANNTAAAFSQAESQLLATPPFIFYRDVIRQVLSMNNQLGEI